MPVGTAVCAVRAWRRQPSRAVALSVAGPARRASLGFSCLPRAVPCLLICGRLNPTLIRFLRWWRKGPVPCVPTPWQPSLWLVLHRILIVSKLILGLE